MADLILYMTMFVAGGLVIGWYLANVRAQGTDDRLAGERGVLALRPESEAPAQQAAYRMKPRATAGNGRAFRRKTDPAYRPLDTDRT